MLVHMDVSTSSLIPNSTATFCEAGAIIDDAIGDIRVKRETIMVIFHFLEYSQLCSGLVRYRNLGIQCDWVLVRIGRVIGAFPSDDKRVGVVQSIRFLVWSIRGLRSGETLRSAFFGSHG